MPQSTRITPAEMDRRKRIVKEISEQAAKEYFMDQDDPEVDLASYIHDAIYAAIDRIFGTQG